MSILKVPRLCREFQNVYQKKQQKEESNRAEKELFWFLKKSIGEDSEQNFIDGFINEIENKYPYVKVQAQAANDLRRRSIDDFKNLI